MANVIAFGRVNSVVVFKYGPRNFKPDWKVLFDTMSLGDALQKAAVLPEEQVVETVGNVATDPPDLPGHYGREDVPESAAKLNTAMLLRDLQLSLTNIDTLHISAESSRNIEGRVIQPQLTQGREPQRLIAEALLDMDLDGWGYLEQILRALERFDSGPGDGATGHRSMSVFFTI